MSVSKMDALLRVVWAVVLLHCDLLLHSNKRFALTSLALEGGDEWLLRNELLHAVAWEAVRLEQLLLELKLLPTNMSTVTWALGCAVHDQPIFFSGLSLGLAVALTVV